MDINHLHVFHSYLLIILTFFLITLKGKDSETHEERLVSDVHAHLYHINLGTVCCAIFGLRIPPPLWSQDSRQAEEMSIHSQNYESQDKTVAKVLLNYDMQFSS